MTATRPDPIDIGDELDTLNAAIVKFAELKREIDAAMDGIIRKTAHRYPTDMQIDWEQPEHTWLNAFSCIRPTDEFAAEVGRRVIRAAMQAHPKRVSMTVNAS